MTGSALVSRLRRGHSSMRLLSCIRFDEVLVLQGAPLLGACFSIHTLTTGELGRIALLAAGSICLVAHVFVLNDWSGIEGDRRDPLRTARVFTTKSVGRTDVGLLAIALLAGSLLMLGPLGATTLVLTTAIAGLSALYSVPSIHMKGIPLANSALHLVGGSLHFLLGFSAFAPLDERAIAISCFFGLVFTAGHLMHEARGREGDLMNGIRTNAVVFGQRRNLIAGLSLFTGANTLLVGLAAFGLVPQILVLNSVLYPVHLYASLRVFRSGSIVESLYRLQRCYRFLYALTGLAMVAALRWT